MVSVAYEAPQRELTSSRKGAPDVRKGQDRTVRGTSTRARMMKLLGFVMSPNTRRARWMLEDCAAEHDLPGPVVRGRSLMVGRLPRHNTTARRHPTTRFEFVRQLRHDVPSSCARRLRERLGEQNVDLRLGWPNRDEWSRT
jgi:hypothetical protein